MLSQSLGNNQAHYNKQVLEFSIKNQQRWRGNLGKKPYNSYNTVIEIIYCLLMVKVFFNDFTIIITFILGTVCSMLVVSYFL